MCFEQEAGNKAKGLNLRGLAQAVQLEHLPSQPLKRESTFITHTLTCNKRNHKCQTEGHPQPKLQATLTTWVEADTKVCKEATCQAKQAAHKADVHQPTAKPVHFQQTKHHLCPNQPNTAVKITTSRAHDVHCKPKGSSPHHNLNQRMKHSRESTAHIRACHRACQKSS